MSFSVTAPFDPTNPFTITGSVAVSNFPLTQGVTQSTSPWIVSGTVNAAPSQGTLTDRSGTAGTSSTVLAAANPNRKYLLIQNISSKAIWINFTTAATAASPSLQIAPNTVFTMESGFVSTEAVNVISGNTGIAYIAKEG